MAKFPGRFKEMMKGLLNAQPSSSSNPRASLESNATSSRLSQSEQAVTGHHDTDSFLSEGTYADSDMTLLEGTIAELSNTASITTPDFVPPPGTYICLRTKRHPLIPSDDNFEFCIFLAYITEVCSNLMV
jgi:hypothetical protein